MADENQPTGNVLPAELYGLFAGAIDQLAVQRFHNALTIATQGGVKKVHVLFQTTGGYVGDGISLYNLFRVSPVEIALYNVGSIQSVGVIAYLGAAERLASQYGAFMIHRAYLSPVAATSDRMSAASGQLSLEDARTEAIFKNTAEIPQEKWEQHKYADVWFSADDAVKYKVAHKIAEFAPPPNTRLFNVWPPQN
jgi:ATP-dependent Clp protease, protease subunit